MTAALPVPSLAEIAYQQVKESILRGELAAGQALGQEELAGRIGTSRVPLREALQRLEAEGLVTLRPRRGYIVTSLDPEEIRDIFDIRMLLEERAGYIATLNATSADIEAVEALLAAMEGMKVRSAADAMLFVERNRAFHTRLYAPSNRPQLCRLMNVLRANVERYIRIGAQIAGNLKRVGFEHQQIFNAYKRRDAQTVGRLCREHCAATGERLIERLAREAK
jgi:DNA-binding GntR family transcriptional regulator